MNQKLILLLVVGLVSFAHAKTSTDLNKKEANKKRLDINEARKIEIKLYKAMMTKYYAQINTESKNLSQEEIKEINTQVNEIYNNEIKHEPALVIWASLRKYKNRVKLANESLKMADTLAREEIVVEPIKLSRPHFESPQDQIWFEMYNGSNNLDKLDELEKKDSKEIS